MFSWTTRIPALHLPTHFRRLSLKLPSGDKSFTFLVSILQEVTALQNLCGGPNIVTLLDVVHVSKRNNVRSNYRK